MQIPQLIAGLLLPALVTTAVLLIARAPWLRRNALVARSRWNLALGLGMAAGFLSLLGTQVFKPTESLHRVFWITLATCGLGVVDSIERRPPWLARLLRLLLALLVPLLLLRSAIEHRWPVSTAALMVLLTAAMLLALLALLAWPGLPAPDRLQPLLLLLTIGGGGAVMLLSGSLKLATLAWCLALLIAAATAVLWFSREPAMPRSAMLLIIVIYASLLMVSHFYAELTIPNLALLLIALVAVHHSPLLVRTLTTWQRTLLRLLLAGLPLALALANAWRTYTASIQGGY